MGSSKESATALSRLGVARSLLNFASEDNPRPLLLAAALWLSTPKAVTSGVQGPLTKAIQEHQVAASAGVYWGELATVVRGLQETSKQRKAEEAARSTAKAEKSKKQTQLNQLRGKVTSREQELAAVLSEQDAKHKALVAAEKQRSTSPPPVQEDSADGATKSDLTAQVKDLTAVKATHEATLAQLQKELQGLQGDIKKVQQRRDAMTKEVSQLQTETTATNAKLLPAEQLTASAARTTQLEAKPLRSLPKAKQRESLFRT